MRSLENYLLIGGCVIGDQVRKTVLSTTVGNTNMKVAIFKFVCFTGVHYGWFEWRLNGAFCIASNDFTNLITVSIQILRLGYIFGYDSTGVTNDVHTQKMRVLMIPVHRLYVCVWLYMCIACKCV